MPGFEEIEHTADWAYTARGATLEELFVNAARGMYHLAGADPDPQVDVTRNLRLQGVDQESLLVAWLNELLYLLESESLAFSRFVFRLLLPDQLDAEIGGSHVWGSPKTIKAVTYNDLAIRKSSNGFETTIVLDV